MVWKKRLGLRWKVLSEGQLNNANYAGRPTVCRNCGALIGATETSCSLCGASKAAAINPQSQSSPSSPQPHVHDGETIRFARAILSRPYIFTIVFIIANVFVFFLTSQAGADENAAVLIRYGAKVNTLIDRQQEWWRFVTPIFLHGNLVHLFMNMYGLWAIGPYVERLYGSAKFVFFWVATGIAGVVASYLSVQPGIHSRSPLGRFLFKDNPNVISVGASGALFGLIGVLFVFGIKFRHELPEGFKRAFGLGMLPTILLNVAIGFMIPVIDNAAHMGGLISGALFALVVGYKRPGERGRVAVFWHVLQIAALALVAFSFLMVARNFNQPYADLSEVTSPTLFRNESFGFVTAINESRGALVAAINNGDQSGIEKATKALEVASAPDERSSALVDELKSLLNRARDLGTTQAPRRGDTQQQRAKLLKLQTDFIAWNSRFNQWVRTEGDNYDIYIPPPEDDSEK
jgi:membrane associated rhomboid family serine protease